MRIILISLLVFFCAIGLAQDDSCTPYIPSWCENKKSFNELISLQKNQLLQKTEVENAYLIPDSFNFGHMAYEHTLYVSQINGKYVARIYFGYKQRSMEMIYSDFELEVVPYQEGCVPREIDEHWYARNL